MPAVKIIISGIVQGIGFRPFIYNLARSLSLFGSVQNNTNGVLIILEGRDVDIEKFLIILKTKPPELSQITDISVSEIELSQFFFDFTIKTSIIEEDQSFNPFLPLDISVCNECKKELFDPLNKRFRYPFISCAKCGPRFSIIKELPYDRERTSMASFKMCKSCYKEYVDPSDRRYHAQTTACLECGPNIKIFLNDGKEIKDNWESVWENSINNGKIVAIKGIGGFHLACNPFDFKAVQRLRKLKKRYTKPFALMFPNLDWIKEICHVSLIEEQILTGHKRPIVLLNIKNKKKFCEIIDAISPGLSKLGIMMPYSGQHELMLDILFQPIILTSANNKGEPLIHDNTEALNKLKNIADIFICHDRQIVNRCDDSVCIANNFVRAARGFAPFWIDIDSDHKCLAFGSDLKNTFALSVNFKIFVSQYIGNLENPETQELLLKSIDFQLNVLKVKPTIIAHDLHPDYFSTRIAKKFAKEHGLPTICVQHHHAHLASCYTEFGLKGKAIGFAFDGTGYGTDGTIWGGEIMLFDCVEFIREIYFKPVPMIGGEMAVKKPERMLASYLLQYNLINESGKKIEEFLDFGVNCPKTSSVGRLFDAVSNLLGACKIQNYDAEAAMKLESLADKKESGTLPFSIENDIIDCFLLFKKLIEGKKKGISTDILASRFHNTLAQIIAVCTKKLIKKYGELPIIFSGGVFQNTFLVSRISNHPELKKHKCFFSKFTNDSGISLGQAAICLKKRWP